MVTVAEKECPVLVNAARDTAEQLKKTFTLFANSQTLYNRKYLNDETLATHWLVCAPASSEKVLLFLQIYRTKHKVMPPPLSLCPPICYHHSKTPPSRRPHGSLDKTVGWCGFRCDGGAGGREHICRVQPHRSLP